MIGGCDIGGILLGETETGIRFSGHVQPVHVANGEDGIGGRNGAVKQFGCIQISGAVGGIPTQTTGQNSAPTMDDNVVSRQ